MVLHWSDRFDHQYALSFPLPLYFRSQVLVSSSNLCSCHCCCCHCRKTRDKVAFVSLSLDDVHIRDYFISKGALGWLFGRFGISWFFSRVVVPCGFNSYQMDLFSAVPHSYIVALSTIIVQKYMQTGASLKSTSPNPYNSQMAKTIKQNLVDLRLRPSDDVHYFLDISPPTQHQTPDYKPSKAP